MGSVDIPAGSAPTERARPDRALGAGEGRSLRSPARLRFRLVHTPLAGAARLGGILLGCAQVCKRLYEDLGI